MIASSSPFVLSWRPFYVMVPSLARSKIILASRRYHQSRHNQQLESTGAKFPIILIISSLVLRILSSRTMLYVIGLGLSDEKDITVRGLEVCLLLVPFRSAGRLVPHRWSLLFIPTPACG